MGFNIMGCILYLFNNHFKYYLDMKNLTPIKKVAIAMVVISLKVAIAMVVMSLTVLILNIIL